MLVSIQKNSNDFSVVDNEEELKYFKLIQGEFAYKFRTGVSVARKDICRFFHTHDHHYLPRAAWAYRFYYAAKTEGDQHSQGNGGQHPADHKPEYGQLFMAGAHCRFDRFSGRLLFHEQLAQSISLQSRSVGYPICGFCFGNCSNRSYNGAVPLYKSCYGKPGKQPED